MSRSRRPKPTRQRIEVRQPNTDDRSPVISGKITRRRPKHRIGGEVRNITDYLFGDIVLPAIKSIVSDFVANGIDMALWGERGQNNRHRSSYSPRRRDYRNYSRSRSNNKTRYDRRERLDDDIDVHNVIFETREDAKLTLGRMGEVIAKYDWVTLGDFYAFVGLESGHTEERYGWDSIRDARIRRIQDGYILDLPEPYFE